MIKQKWDDKLLLTVFSEIFSAQIEYSAKALEPISETINYHYGKHHLGYAQ